MAPPYSKLASSALSQAMGGGNISWLLGDRAEGNSRNFILINSVVQMAQKKIILLVLRDLNAHFQKKVYPNE